MKKLVIAFLTFVSLGASAITGDQMETFLKNNPSVEATLNDSKQVGACIAGYHLELIGDPISLQLLNATLSHLDRIGDKEHRTLVISFAQNRMLALDPEVLKQKMEKAGCDNLTKALKAAYYNK